MALDVPTICLGLLTHGEATGYDLKKSIEEGPAGTFLDASFGSIYPALSRLTREGLVRVREEKGDRGRPKKIYAITETGTQRFAETLRGVPGEDRVRLEYLFFLMFSDVMDPAHIRLILDRRIGDQKMKLSALKARAHLPATSGERFVRGYGIRMLELSIQYLEDHRHLIDHRPEASPRASAGQRGHADAIAGGEP